MARLAIGFGAKFPCAPFLPWMAEFPAVAFLPARVCAGRGSHDDRRGDRSGDHDRDGDCRKDRDGDRHDRHDENPCSGRNRDADHGHDGHSGGCRPKQDDRPSHGDGCGSGGGTSSGVFTVLTGTPEPDSLDGGNGADSITGLGSDDTLAGANGDDILLGGDGADGLDGGNGNDTLNGGSGIDTLTGGLGADVFRFDAPLAEDTADYIVDFTGGTDRIEVARALTNITATGAIDPAIFTQGGDGIFPEDRFILDTVNNVLYYDADGDGDSPNLAIATFAPGTVVTAADIYIA